MGEKKQLGVYFSHDSVYFAEVFDGRLEQSFSIELSQDDFNEFETNQFLAPSNNLANKINTALAEHHITTKEANLSLPGKDIIFRSFIVPWMQPNELEGVIQFEVNKYIPFRIEELRNVYHWNPINLGGMKKIQVIFVAIRYSTLQKYENLFHKIGININITEPSVNSLLKILAFKNKITMDKTVALIEHEGTGGKITVVDKGLPLFVRDFQVAAGTPDKGDYTQKFINETRVSLDYFARQENSITVKEAVLISSAEEAQLQTALTTDLGIAVTECKSRTLIENQIVDNTAFLKAMGSCLDVVLPAAFNLAIKEIETKKDVVKFDFNAIKPPNYILMGIFIVIAVVICFIVRLAQQIPLEQARAEFKSISGKLGLYNSSSIEDLKTKKTTIEEKVKGLELVPSKSKVAYFINAVPAALPAKGIWLTNFSVAYSQNNSFDSKDSASKKKSPNIALSGYAYDEVASNQINLIAEFLDNLRKNSKLKNFYKPEDIYREDMTSRDINGHKVTAFSVKLR
ncbi:MAG: pilus assembly protein PilM [Candidatus Omnitrophica bacterium]|nr:pilus assembly protein PilM [Candidatus Omnitrophota bacterium]